MGITNFLVLHHFGGPLDFLLISGVLRVIVILSKAAEQHGCFILSIMMLSQEVSVMKIPSKMQKVQNGRRVYLSPWQE
jgi:hypothetical protein